MWRLTSFSVVVLVAMSGRTNKCLAGRKGAARLVMD